MNNNRVLAGLKHCATTDSCIGCPYHSTDYCTQRMCADALALFEEQAKPIMPEPRRIKVYCYAKPKYHTTYVFVKHTNLLEWFKVNDNNKYRTVEEYNRAKEYYSRERPVQLELHVRHEHDGKCYALIQCPINPTSDRGETCCIKDKKIAEIKSHGWELVSIVDYIG